MFKLVGPGTYCPFCETRVKEPEGENFFDQSFTCSGCGARYWAEMIYDVWEALYQAEEIFELPVEDIEWKVVRGFDYLRDYPGQSAEEAQEVCLVFFRKKED